MRFLVSFSGGLGSWAAAKRIVAAHGTQDVTLIFADTLAEDNDLYRVLVESAANVFGLGDQSWVVGMLSDCPEIHQTEDPTLLAKRKGVLAAIRDRALAEIPGLRWIVEGRTPWEVMHDSRFIVNSRVDPCSRILKRHFIAEYTAQHFSRDDTTLIVGIDWSEQHRLQALQERSDGWKWDSPLIARPNISKAGMLQWYRSEGLKPAGLYEAGFPHNNCGGGCPKAGISQWVHLLKTRPAAYLYHERQEQRLREHLGRDDIAMLKDRRGGTARPMTLAALRQRVEAGDKFRELEEWGEEWGGCGCAIDVDEPVQLSLWPETGDHRE